MQRKLNQDEFEQFLKNNADDLLLRPSAAVWENISRDLNRQRRRLIGFFLLTFLFVGAGLSAWFTINLSNKNIEAKTQPATHTTSPYSRSLPAPEQVAANTTHTNKNGNKITAASPRQQAAGKVAAPAGAGAFFPATNQVADNLIAPLETLAAQWHSNTAPDAPISRTVLPVPLQSLAAQVPNTLLANSQPKQLAAATDPATNAAAPLPETGTARALAAAKIHKSRRLSWTVFVTPTVSYRKLSENKSFERPFLTPGTPPTVSALYNINNAVIHKPDLGLEFGTMAHYAVSRNLRLRTGFQFNISRYDIKAFSYVPEVATIALNNGFWVDSVRAISNYRNFNGGRSNWLQNFYFQASLPVGLDLKVAGNKKFQWGVASSVQPTYIIGNRAYLITADYKNYARVPWLTRRWNVNTNFETFVSYRAGKTEWHVGPQVRYQLLSSFVKKYPVKENLFDFGMKVGVTIR